MYIKSHLSNRYGKPILFSRECEDLAAHIKWVTGVKVSPQTLRRILGFINDGVKANKSTLQVIASYCGFDDIAQLNNPSKELTHVANKDQLGLIKSFYSIELSSDFDFNYQKACGNVALTILKNYSYLEALSGFLCKNEVAQIFFYERFPYIDGITGLYKKHFKRYVQSKKNPESQIFGHSILLLGAFLSNNKAEMQKEIKQINLYQTNAEMHPFPQARKIMSNLIYHYFVGNLNEIIFWKKIALEEEKKQLRGCMSKANFPYFQFTMADAFNLIGAHQEALEMLNRGDLDYKAYDNGVIETGYFECFDLIKAIAYYHTGKKLEAIRILNRIESSKFIFICHDYFLIQKKILELQMCASTKTAKYAKIRLEINWLIDKTGFTFFKKYNGV